jgi:hypothetical protein
MPTLFRVRGSPPRAGEGLGERFFLAGRAARSVWKHVGSGPETAGP